MKRLTEARRIEASFRDPGGHVYLRNGRILRSVRRSALADVEFLEQSGIFADLSREGLLVQTVRTDGADLAGADDQACAVLEHPKLPFVSYPYEWSFDLLKDAALLHLDLHLRALSLGATLSDASVYNVQFIGCRPVFIDALSLRRYREGEYWLGHRQFCEQFLAPLILQSVCGIPHNAWLRGSIAGIPLPVLAKVLPLRSRVSPRMLLHVLIPAALQNRAQLRPPSPKGMLQTGSLSKMRFEGLLRQLRQWIAQMELSAVLDKSTWHNYPAQSQQSYANAAAKRRFVAEFISREKPAVVWDLGCNDGEYSQLCLDAGAASVIGFDADHGALHRAYQRARESQLHFMPLYLEASDPTPSQGWRGSERAALMERRNADAVLGLAFLHHIAIRSNIPLPDAVRWVTELAPRGVLEFVPKTDETVQRMLSVREDIFSDYSRETFVAALSRHARIVASEVVAESGREIFAFDRR